MLRIYIIGISILLIAIVINIIAEYFNLTTWYEFISLLSSEGMLDLRKVGFINCIYLFIIYPMLLGLGYKLGNKIYYYIY